jgi:hypothetical protein
LRRCGDRIGEWNHRYDVHDDSGGRWKPPLQDYGGWKPPLRIEAPTAMFKTPIPFRGFVERGEVRVYAHGTLPHWRQPGCTYFVTFRLADSIPEAVLREHEYERSMWLKARSINPDDPHSK